MLIEINQDNAINTAIRLGFHHVDLFSMVGKRRGYVNGGKRGHITALLDSMLLEIIKTIDHRHDTDERNWINPNLALISPPVNKVRAPKSRNHGDTENEESIYSSTMCRISARNPFPEVPQSSRICLDGRTNF